MAEVGGVRATSPKVHFVCVLCVSAFYHELNNFCLRMRGGRGLYQKERKSGVVAGCPERERESATNQAPGYRATLEAQRGPNEPSQPYSADPGWQRPLVFSAEAGESAELSAGARQPMVFAWRGQSYAQQMYVQTGCHMSTSSKARTPAPPTFTQAHSPLTPSQQPRSRPMLGSKGGSVGDPCSGARLRVRCTHATRGRICKPVPALFW